MEVEITADGTEVVYVRDGVWCLDISATTWGGSTQVAIKAGAASDGSDHVPVKDAFGDARVASENFGDCICYGGKHYSFVTSSYSGSAGLVARFKRSVPASS